jgi:hypothetical protein
MRRRFFVTHMPFLSRRQQRWAFANKKRFARRWAKETPSFAALPERKDAGTVAGPSLAGPGGLLGYPGLGKRDKATKITGNLYRGETGQFQAGGADAPSSAKRRPPAKTDQERAERRRADQAERQTARAQEQAQNRAEVLRSLNIAPDGAEALAKLRAGDQPDPAAIARAGFVAAGLVEQAQDGSYRMTPSGRALLSAADAGDRGRAGDTISRGRDRVGARRQRAERKVPAPAPAAASAPAKKKKPVIDIARRMRRINRRIAQMRQRHRLKAQTAEDRAMFAKMGGGGSGGGGKAGGGAANWPKGPDGKRHPTAAQVNAMQSKLDARRDQLEKNPPKDRTRALRERSDIKRRQFDLNEHKERAEHALDKNDHDLRNRRRDVVERQRRAKPGSDDIRYLSRVLNDIDSDIQAIKRDRRALAMAGKSFTVYKDHTGAHRWIARTTTAYRDRDREILPIAALDADSQRMTAMRQFGPLRWWHVGRPEPLNEQAPWGAGLDLGDCDFSMQIGTTRVESGTFKSAALGQRIAETAAEYELSPGFFHPPDQPGADGVFTTIRTFERSLVPTRYGRASNLFTGLTVKEQRMEPDEMERRFKAAIEQLRLPADQAAALADGLIHADKSAQAQGIAYKSDDAPAVYTAPDGSPGIIVDGRFVTLKAAPPPFAEKAPMPAEEMVEAGETELSDGLDEEGMDDAAFAKLVAKEVMALIAPLFGDMKMSEMKAIFATKDAGRAQEIATLEATLKSVQDQLAALSGLQPSVGLPADIEAALKSQGPQPPPDPNAPQIPADASPLTQLAARLAPQLYATAPNGVFNGWTPPVLPQS